MSSLNKHNLNFDQSGFTLLETMTVMSIITLLTSLFLSAYVNAKRSARDVILKQTIRVLDTSFRTYAADIGDFPQTLNESAVSSPGLDSCADKTSCSAMVPFTALVSGNYINQVPYPPSGFFSGSNGFWYFHRVTGKSASAQIANTCFMGQACGFTDSTMTFSQCVSLSGAAPADTPAKAAVFFWLETGISKDYVDNKYGGNAICFY